MDINIQKKELRKKVKVLKSGSSASENQVKSESIFKKIAEMDVFREARTIMAYWSMKDEVNTHEFIFKYFESKRIILPSVKGNELELKVFEGTESMQPGESFGILEPVGPTFDKTEKMDLIIIPGVAFDKQKNRMGRGKAYYDNLLKSTDALKIGVCFDFQLFDEVPVDEHDIKMDLVITN